MLSRVTKGMEWVLGALMWAVAAGVWLVFFVHPLARAIDEEYSRTDMLGPSEEIWYERSNWVYRVTGTEVFLDPLPYFQQLVGDVQQELWMCTLALALILGWLVMLCLRSKERPGLVVCVGWGMLMAPVVSFAMSFAKLEANYLSHPKLVGATAFGFWLALMVGISICFATHKSLTGRSMLWRLLAVFGIGAGVGLAGMMAKQGMAVFAHMPYGVFSVMVAFFAICLVATGAALGASYGFHGRNIDSNQAQKADVQDASTGNAG